jgi:predicted nucleic acid-binding Zn ribbon protein
MQHFRDEPLQECPECGGHVHRVLQPVGIIFKGSGFYVTDNYRSSSVSGGTQKGTETPKESEGKKASPTSESGSRPTKTEAAD